jgi:DNA excision repair protein ERCC-4
MQIVIDTREQVPFCFDRFDCETNRAVLPVGDYSIQGHEGRAAIERKNGIDELVACLSRERDRFERELQRATDYSLFAVVVGGRFADLIAGRFRSRMTSKAVLASICAFHVRYGVPFLFAEDRAGAERLIFGLLSKFHREIELPSHLPRKGCQ